MRWAKHHRDQFEAPLESTELRDTTGRDVVADHMARKWGVEAGFLYSKAQVEKIYMWGR